MKFALRTFLITILILGVISLLPQDALAQCAMCRATLENNVSNGEVGISGNLNTGILYLFAMPYLLVGFIAYMWYRKSRENAGIQSYSSR